MRSGSMCYIVPCPSLAVDSTLRVGTAGVNWGLCMGPYDARKLGAFSGIPRAYFLVKSVGKFSFQCRLVTGVFTATRCGIQRYRRGDDWVNSLAAGAVAGVAAGTRSWTHVLGMACLASVCSAAIDFSSTN
ncbi:hypothetical protein ACJRO7_030407 [Eucalyptus globulus]|uniref:Uncharacterized protein n=1 Tax=Eucalyptus globulus TaxID=34317 RepID=A0ABD3JEL9_EUCGL